MTYTEKLLENKTISKQYIVSNWNSPNVWGCNFKYPPKNCGVYIIVMYYNNRIAGEPIKNRIIYIGSSSNLLIRFRNHNIIKYSTNNIRVFFKECNDFTYREKLLIKYFKPFLNKTWKN